MALSEPHIISADARIIRICQEMLVVHQEIDDLTDRDPYAPDCGPNHARHKALWKEFRALKDQLTEAAPPPRDDPAATLSASASLV